jgi:hypothetical protein
LAFPPLSGAPRAATLNIEALASELRDALRRAGLRDPSVEIEIVANLPHTITGKVTRFVALRG